MQAIETKFLGPTNYKGSRIKATCSGGSLILSRDFDYEISENHKHAAYLLAEQLGWDVFLIGGELKNGNYVWVISGEKV